MSTMYISEYADSGNLLGGLPLGAEPCLDQAPVTISASSAQSAAFQNNTRLVRVHVDVISSIKFGTNPTAVTVSNKRMNANTTEYFLVPMGQAYKVAVVTST